jgi:hypothetical protein
LSGHIGNLEHLDLKDIRLLANQRGLEGLKRGFEGTLNGFDLHKDKDKDQDKDQEQDSSKNKI